MEGRAIWIVQRTRNISETMKMIIKHCVGFDVNLLPQDSNPGITCSSGLE